MVSRERLLRLGTTFAEYATARRVRIVAQVLFFIGIVFVVTRVRSLWHGSHIEVATINWLAVVTAVVAAAAAVVLASLVWLHILRRLGIAPRRRWAGIYMQAQLGKYIPGSVWQYAGRAALARGEGISLRALTVSLTVELAGSVTAAALVTSLLGGVLAIAGVGGATVLAAGIWRLVRQKLAVARRIESSAAMRATFEATLLYLPIWLLLGLCFWLTGRSLFHVSFDHSVFYTGAFTVAWLVGLIAVFAPGGLGVREAVLVALLRSRTGTADAVLLAVASRALLTVVDLVAGACGALVLRRIRKTRPVEEQAEDQSSRWAKTTNPVP
jgi:glycosyltransferase 2 family protein